MGAREQLIRDCALLGDFAVKSVETMKAHMPRDVDGRWWLTRYNVISYNTLE